MLDEKALRRPEWVEGVAIVLADGTAWTFPKPTLDFFPMVNPEGGPMIVGGRATFGPEYEALIDALEAAGSGSGIDWLKAKFAVAMDLLGRNYRLEPADFGRLLRHRPDDEANQATWQAILDVAVGNAPKPTPVGEESSSSPTG